MSRPAAEPSIGVTWNSGSPTSIGAPSHVRDAVICREQRTIHSSPFNGYHIEINTYTERTFSGLACNATYTGLLQLHPRRRCSIHAMVAGTRLPAAGSTPLWRGRLRRGRLPATGLHLEPAEGDLLVILNLEELPVHLIGV